MINNVAVRNIERADAAVVKALGEHGCEFPEDVFYAWGGMPTVSSGSQMTMRGIILG